MKDFFGQLVGRTFEIEHNGGTIPVRITAAFHLDNEWYLSALYVRGMPYGKTTTLSPGQLIRETETRKSEASCSSYFDII